jgi:hypothetical protein
MPGEVHLPVRYRESGRKGKAKTTHLPCLRDKASRSQARDIYKGPDDFSPSPQRAPHPLNPCLELLR